VKLVASFFFVILTSDSCYQQDMPAAEGAVAAAAVADQMYFHTLTNAHLPCSYNTLSLDYLTCSYIIVFCFT
jgi:hypothetical protein